MSCSLTRVYRMLRTAQYYSEPLRTTQNYLHKRTEESERRISFFYLKLPGVFEFTSDMGGGDLNLKKSWHPSTMKNMEKVWKAEQQDHQEKKRIAELKREIEMEKDREDMTKFAMDQGVVEKKDDKKLDWMYKGPNQAVNREDYLLGRAIDKPFEQMAQAEKDMEMNRLPKNHVEHECIPPSLRFFSGNEQVDLARKLQEDPLCAIKKKEMETRSQLLKNPVKLKQLKQLLEEQARRLAVEEKSQKKRKKRKKHDRRDSSADSDKELDNLLTEKYNKLKNKISEKDLMISMKRLKKEKKKAKKKRRKEASSSESNENELNEKCNSVSRLVEKKKNTNKDEDDPRKHWNKVPHNHPGREYDHNSSKRFIHELELQKNHKRTSTLHDQRREERSASRNPREHHYRLKSEAKMKRGHDPYQGSDNEDSHVESSLAGNYGLLRPDGTKILMTPKSRIQDVSASPERKINEKSSIVQKRKRLTDEEKEQRRREMIANASWRDKEREKNVKRYRDEEKRELTDKTYDKEFLRKQLAVAAEAGTVESRIKANINNIQRSGRAMDSNFAKR